MISYAPFLRRKPAAEQQKGQFTHDHERAVRPRLGRD